jgi:hypothetical protein
MPHRLLVLVFFLTLLSGVVAGVIVRFTLPAAACQNEGWITDKDIEEFEKFFGERPGGSYAR